MEVTVSLEVETLEELLTALRQQTAPVKQTIGFDTTETVRERNADLAEENARLRGLVQGLQTQVDLLTVRVLNKTAAQLPPPIVEAPAQITHSEVTVGGGGIELDDAGNPYDPEIHSSSKTKTEKGLWRKRKGTGRAGQVHEDSSSEVVSTAVAITPVPVTLGEERGSSIDDATPREWEEAAAVARGQLKLTLDDVRAALQKFQAGFSGKYASPEADKAAYLARAKEILAKHDAKLIPELKAEKYGAFIADLGV